PGARQALHSFPTRRSSDLDRVKTQDVLADHVQIGGPEGREFTAVGLRIADRAQIIDQRVEPDIYNVPGVARHRDAPREAGARDRDRKSTRLNSSHLGISYA